MKTKILYTLLLVTLFSACGPGQKITTSWINPEARGRDPFKSIFVMVLAKSHASSFDVEERMATTINSRGNKAVMSGDVFPPQLAVSESLSQEQMAEAIKKTGCDAVFIIAVLDVLKTETYHPGSSYYPNNYGMYGSYYGYYNYYYPQVILPATIHPTEPTISRAIFTISNQISSCGPSSLKLTIQAVSRAGIRSIPTSFWPNLRKRD